MSILFLSNPSRVSKLSQFHQRNHAAKIKRENKHMHDTQGKNSAMSNPQDMVHSRNLQTCLHSNH